MYIIDACAIINLSNCALWEVFGEHFSSKLCFQGLVEDECLSMVEQLNDLVDRWGVLRFDGSKILAREVAAIATSYSIGLGESECLVIAIANGYGFISDDKKARSAARTAMPNSDVIGTIGVLCKLIDSGKIGPNDATEALNGIRLAGGHIPDFDFRRRIVC